MDHLKQERTTELSTRGFTTVTKLKAMLKKLGIKLSKKSNLKAELIHIFWWSTNLQTPKPPKITILVKARVRKQIQDLHHALVHVLR